MLCLPFGASNVYFLLGCSLLLLLFVCSLQASRRKNTAENLISIKSMKRTCSRGLSCIRHINHSIFSKPMICYIALCCYIASHRTTVTHKSFQAQWQRTETKKAKYAENSINDCAKAVGFNVRVCVCVSKNYYFENSLSSRALCRSGYTQIVFENKHRLQNLRRQTKYEELMKKNNHFSQTSHPLTIYRQRCHC